MISTSTFLFNAGLAVLVYVTAIWLISLAKRDAGIMDIFWGPGFILAVLATAAADASAGFRGYLVMFMVTIWGLRLAAHIGYRNWNSPEDARYAKWREENGSSWWWKSYLKVFLLQGSIMLIVALPLVAVVTSGQPKPIGYTDFAAILLFLAGFLFESVGDYQLLRFKSDPANAGKVMNSGLWKYTRHPNYFGEAVLWWGFFLLALSDGFFLTIISPVLMTFLLLKVSGVRMLDDLLKSTKPDYAEYIRTTNAFFPGRPKK